MGRGVEDQHGQNGKARDPSPPPTAHVQQQPRSEQSNGQQAWQDARAVGAKRPAADQPGSGHERRPQDE